MEDSLPFFKQNTEGRGHNCRKPAASVVFPQPRTPRMIPDNMSSSKTAVCHQKPPLIRAADPHSRDASAVAAIYNHYVTSSIITFEEHPISPAEARRRITTVNEAGLPWLVAESDGAIVGYAYAAGWKPRPAYRHSSEVSVYVAPAHQSKGLGSALYGRLLPELERSGIHVALSGIALPNPASVALHERHGFCKVAQLCEVGFKFGRWIDVGYWQLTFSSSGSLH